MTTWLEHGGLIEAEASIVAATCVYAMDQDYDGDITYREFDRFTRCAAFAVSTRPTIITAAAVVPFRLSMFFLPCWCAASFCRPMGDKFDVQSVRACEVSRPDTNEDDSAPVHEFAQYLGIDPHREQVLPPLVMCSSQATRKHNRQQIFAQNATGPALGGRKMPCSSTPDGLGRVCS